MELLLVDHRCRELLRLGLCLVLLLLLGLLRCQRLLNRWRCAGSTLLRCRLLLLLADGGRRSGLLLRLLRVPRGTLWRSSGAVCGSVLGGRHASRRLQRG